METCASRRPSLTSGAEPCILCNQCAVFCLGPGGSGGGGGSGSGGGLYVFCRSRFRLHHTQVQVAMAG